MFEMNKQQMEDREQFRRYAEAALSAMRVLADYSNGPCDAVLMDRSFSIATRMMLGESRAFEEYQLKALEAIVDDERIKHEGK
jgi:hypothetical protein